MILGLDSLDLKKVSDLNFPSLWTILDPSSELYPCTFLDLSSLFLMPVCRSVWKVQGPTTPAFQQYSAVLFGRSICQLIPRTKSAAWGQFESHSYDTRIKTDSEQNSHETVQWRYLITRWAHCTCCKMLGRSWPCTAVSSISWRRQRWWRGFWPCELLSYWSVAGDPLAFLRASVSAC